MYFNSCTLDHLMRWLSCFSSNRKFGILHISITLYWHIYRGLNSIFSKWRKTEEGSRNCTSITVTCVISTSWGCCPNNDYHVTILTYVSCDHKQTKKCMSAWLTCLVSPSTCTRIITWSNIARSRISS